MKKIAVTSKAWEPSEDDVEWTRRLIFALNDQGTWAIPANHSIWRLDKKQKVAYLEVKGDPESDLNEKVRKAFHAVGWKTNLD